MSSLQRDTKRTPVVLLARELGAGGSERQLTEIAKAIDKSLFDVRVGYFRDGFRHAELTKCGIPTFQLQVTSFRTPQAIRAAIQFARYLRSDSIQIVHTFDYPLTCFAVPLARACGVPVVLSSQRSRRELIPRSYRRLVGVTDLIVDGIVVNCRAIANHLAAEDVALRHIHLCYNGIDPELYAPDECAANTTSESLVIGCVAVLRPEKNLSLLIEAFSRLERSYPRLRLLIVGSGPDEVRLRQLVHGRDFETKCHFRPAEQDVRESLREIDIFVLPSLTEAFSNSLMEAMSSSCAVVASNTGGIPELIEHEQTGLLFANDNIQSLMSQLTYLIESPSRRRQLGEQARENIKKRFSITAAAHWMESIYTRLLTATQR